MVYNTNKCKKNKTTIIATSTTKVTKHDLQQSMLLIFVCMKNIEYVQVAGGVRNEQQILMSGFPVGKGFHKNQTIIHVSQMQIESHVSQFENECCCYLACQWFCAKCLTCNLGIANIQNACRSNILQVSALHTIETMWFCTASGVICKFGARFGQKPSQIFTEGAIDVAWQTC